MIEFTDEKLNPLKKKHLLIVMDKNVHLTSLVEVLTLAK